jgi:hypothetical protein
MARAINCGLLLAAISFVNAQAAQVVGHGSFSCGNWTADHRHLDVAAVTDNAWLAGYLSAYSVYEGDKLDLPDQDARDEWVSNYCRKHPLDLISQAADQLIIELVGRQTSQR